MSGASKLGSAVIAVLAVSLITAEADRQQVGAQAAKPAATGAVPAGDAAALARRIDQIVADADPLDGARLGAVVTDVRTGQVVYQRDPDGRYNLASNTKIITTAAALHVLGPGHRFRTELRAEKIEGDAVAGDLYVVGGGDPTLDRARLRELVDNLVLLGIKRIRGSIAIDDTLYDDVVLPPHFDAQPKEQAAFRAPVSAVSVEENAVAVWLRPLPGGAGPAVVTVDPPNDYVRVVGSVQTTATGRNTVKIKTVVTPDHLELHIGGQLPVSSGLTRYRRRIEDPALYFAEAFRAQLDAAGIAVTRRKVVRAAAPETAIVLTAVASAPLAEVIRQLGKRSNNYVAEMLLKAIGAATLTEKRPATWSDGTTAVHRFLEHEVGVTAGSYRYDNGSGLFDASEMSPRQLSQVLAYVARDPRYGVDHVSSLSIGGVDGTLRKRMKDSPATGLVRGKTGTLAAVSTLSGFIAADARSPLAFALLVNDQPTTYKGKKAGRATLDAIAGALAEYLGTPGP